MYPVGTRVMVGGTPGTISADLGGGDYTVTLDGQNGRRVNVNRNAITPIRDFAPPVDGMVEKSGGSEGGEAPPAAPPAPPAPGTGGITETSDPVAP